MKATHTWKRAAAFGLVATIGLSACADEQLPTGVVDPKDYRTESAILKMYNGTLITFHTAMTNTIVPAGVLSDELESGLLGRPPLSGSTIDPITMLDARRLPEGGQSYTDDLYKVLQTARAGVGPIRDAMAKYAPNQPKALRARMHFMEAMSEILLADVFCSGIPLSTVELEKDYTYRQPSPTPDVYRHAVELLDTALTLVGDSSALESSIRVAQGRALLSLGEYERAGQVVAAVPDAFVFQIPIAAILSSGSPGVIPGADVKFLFTGSVSDREGPLGAAWRSANDPRVKVVSNGNNESGRPIYRLGKYTLNTPAPLVIASGVEARLIQAEAALKAKSPTWIGILNQLRATQVTPALPDLVDPVDDNARLDMLFMERGMWLYFTGHRQGDLRRLVREYRRNPEAVYPTGAFPTPGMGSYGTDVTAPIPRAEQANPYFKGCIDRNA